MKAFIRGELQVVRQGVERPITELGKGSGRPITELGKGSGRPITELGKGSGYIYSYLTVGRQSSSRAYIGVGVRNIVGSGGGVWELGGTRGGHLSSRVIVSKPQRG
jgi:hypothetical protein